MIHVVCPNCRKRFGAPDHLAGQSGKCPSCAGPITVPEPSTVTLAESRPGQHVHDALDHDLPLVRVPERLVRAHRYLICDKEGKIVAVWKNDGHCWMLRVSAGYISAKRNPAKLPSHGHYGLIQLKLRPIDGGTRLGGLASYTLSYRWALPLLARDDDEILGKLEGPVGLSLAHKNCVRQYLRDSFMHQVWANSRVVMDFLGNNDFHTAEVEEPEDA